MDLGLAVDGFSAVRYGLCMVKFVIITLCIYVPSLSFAADDKPIGFYPNYNSPKTNHKDITGLGVNSPVRMDSSEFVWSVMALKKVDPKTVGVRIKQKTTDVTKEGLQEKIAVQLDILINAIRARNLEQNTAPDQLASTKKASRDFSRSSKRLWRYKKIN